jgi:glycosyltransferase involved in cell wall biosynthesis
LTAANGAAARLRGVCILATDIDGGTGGVQIQSRRLAAGLGELGIPTFIISRNYWRRPRREQLGSTLILRSPVLRRSATVANSLFYLLFAVALMIRFRNHYSVIQCQQMFGSAMAGLIAKRLLGKPVVVRVTSTGELGEVASLRTIRGSETRRKQLLSVDRWVALTQLMKDEIASIGVASERVSIIPNSAEILPRPWFEPGVRAEHRRKLALPDVPTALYSGRLSSEKGLDTLLDAWKIVAAQIPSARLLIAGAGGAFRNVEPQLREQHTRLGLESSVDFRGHVDNVADYLRACDVFVLPTRTEGMSNSLVEAMAAGVPIVTSDIPSHAGVIDHESEALLVKPDDAPALAQALLAVLQDATLAQRLARAARARAERELSPRDMIRRYLDLYAQALDGR